MIRSLYIRMLRLYPRSFQERFGAEMIETFDELEGTLPPARLLLDTLRGVVRQRLNPSVPQCAVIEQALPFRTMESSGPPPIVFLWGALLAGLSFWTVAWATSHGRGTFSLLIGTPTMRLGALPVSRDSVTASDQYVGVEVQPAADDPWRDFASRYFQIIYILRELDADRDHVISAGEIAASPAALRKLDLDHDGWLSAEECGFYAPRTPGFVELLRMKFMEDNPVLRVLDADRDGKVGTLEIGNAPAALRGLDLNGDGRLLPVEIAPDAVAKKILEIAQASRAFKR
jgi:hypothetical protein